MTLLAISVQDTVTLYLTGQSANKPCGKKYPFGDVETERQAVYIESLCFVWNSEFLKWKSIDQIVGD